MNCGIFLVTADFLYWRAENQGFSYAYELQDVIDNVGTVIRVNPAWEPAFRVGLGWNTKSDFWDVLLNYTWYQNKSHRSSSNEDGFIVMMPLSSEDTGEGEFRKVVGKDHFLMNMGDLEIGRLVYLTKSVAVRPHIGAEGGTLHQKFSTDFSNRVIGYDLSAFTFSGKNNYWGVGPRVGLNGEWHMGAGFSWVGKLAGALLYGQTQVNSKSDTLTVGDSEFEVDRHYTDSFYQQVPHLQMSLGFQWETCFWCQKMFYRMGASWETNYWWNQFNLPIGVADFTAPLPTVGNQALTMEGLTVNFEFDF